MLVALNSVFQILAFAGLGWFYLEVLPGWLGLEQSHLAISFWDIAVSVLVFLGVPLLAGYLSRRIGEAVKAMKIGPGTAPEAKLTSLRVFGCEGSTNLVGAALDRTLDPNGDGDYSDAAQIASISIGSDFGIADDPENDIVNALNRAGVLSVIAAGNAGDSYDVAGSPGSATSALTVANSIGSTVAVDQAEVLAPEDVKGDVTGSYSQSFDYTAAKPEQLEGTVTTVPEANKYGCQPFTGQDFAGKWVYLDWADDATGQYPCGSKVRFDNAQNAGAKGVVLTHRNLVANAIEHGQGQPVVVTLRANSTAVSVSVRDYGIGLKEGEADKVFDRFWRADPARARTTGGTGLGLSISLEDARLHDGFLEAWGAPGEGSCFRLTLPRVQGVAIAASPGPL